MVFSTMQELITQGKMEGKVEGKMEGKMEVLHNAILKVLRKRFTMVPLGIETMIQKMNDPIALESLHSYALDCLTLDEFATALR